MSANLVTDMSNIASISNNEPVAPLATAPASNASAVSNRAGAAAVQPVDRVSQQATSVARDILRQSEAIEELRAALSANARTRLQIERDEEANGRYIYKLMDPETGEVLRRWPPEKFGDLVAFLKGEANTIINERA